jgi:hypothetical protein
MISHVVRPAIGYGRIQEGTKMEDCAGVQRMREIIEDRTMLNPLKGPTDEQFKR